MKNKFFGFFSKLVVVVAGCLMFASFSPSLDGRAVVVDEGVFPQGLFAKTVGYLPGDTISVTNISGDKTVDILVIGALDASEGVAIMLSPEAAQALGIEPNSNCIVKITKRSGIDERVYGTAVIATQNIDFEEELAAEEETEAEVEEPAVENTEVEPETDLNAEFEEAYEPDEADLYEEPATPAVEDSLEENYEDDYAEDFTPFETISATEETEEEETYEQPELVEEELEEEAFEPEDDFYESYGEESDEENIPLDDVEEADYEDPSVEEEEYTEENEEIEQSVIEPEDDFAFEDDFIEENIIDEEPPLEDDEIPEESTEETPELEEETEDFVEEEQIFDDEETPSEESYVPEDNFYEGPAPESETDEEEYTEENAELNDSEEEFYEEEPLEDILIPADQPETSRNSVFDEPTVDVVEELDDETEELLAESFEDDEYDAIVLVPVEDEEQIPVEEPAVEEEQPVLEPLPVVNANVAESDAVVPSETPVETPAEEPQPQFVRVPATNTIPYEQYVKPSLSDLDSSKYYIQIAALANDANIMELISKYASNYPITIVPKPNNNVKLIFVGPVTIDEYKVVLERFKSYGFKDAFIKKLPAAATTSSNGEK